MTRTSQTCQTSQTSLASSSSGSDCNVEAEAGPGSLDDTKARPDDAAPDPVDKSFTFQPHRFAKKRYYLPKYCDVCRGILLGTAYKCRSCGMRCHVGYGSDKHEDCHAEALWSTCGAPVAHLTGKYHFGDVTAQKLRDIRSKARRRIVSEVVAEQRGFGRMEQLKVHVSAFRSTWDRVTMNWFLLQWQLGTAASLAVLSYLAVRLALRNSDGDSARAHRLAVLQAASNLSALLLLEGCLASALYFAAVRIKRNSALLHVFVLDMAKVNLEDLGIDIKEAAGTVKRIASSTISVTSLLLLATCAVWWDCLLTV